MRTRVQCANCGMVYERPQVKACPACKSNAADPVQGDSLRREHTTPPSGPKPLTDDMPAHSFPIGGVRSLED